MGVSAQALLTTNPSPLEVMDFLNKEFHVTDVNLTPSSIEAFVHINFKWSGEQRNMSVFYNGSCKCDYEHLHPMDSVYCSVGAWGFSEAIVYTLAKKFGGLYCFNDSEGDWIKYEG